MKKGTAVKFIGTDTRFPIEKTFIWDVAISKNETVYLIEHPQGTELNATTEKEFTGFNVAKLQHGKKYMAVEPRELISLEPVSIQETAPKQEVEAMPEMITTTMPRAYFEEIKEYLAQNKEQLTTNKMIKLTMKKDDFAAAINFFDQMILATDGALKQPQIKEETPKIHVTPTTKSNYY